MKKIPLSLSIIFSTNQYSKCDTFRWKMIQHSWSRERRAIYCYHLTADSWNYSAQCHSPTTVQRSQMFSEQKSSRWKLLLVLKISPEHVFDLLCQYFQWPQLQLNHFSKLIWTNKVRAEYWLELAAATVGLDCYETCKCLRAYSDWLYGDFTVFEAELHTSCPQDKYIYFLNKSYLLFHYHPGSCLPDNSLNLNLKQTSQSVISIIEAIICFCGFGKQITWFFLNCPLWKNVT